MTVETTPTTKTLKDLGWHLRAADPATDKGEAGWVQENAAAGLKTRVFDSAADAGLAARKIERARHDPSADLRTCEDCRFTYDANDANEAEEHADHSNAAGEPVAPAAAAVDERPGGDPWAHEEEIKGRIVEFLGEQGVEVDGVGTTPLGASYLAVGHELVVIGCGQHSQGLRGHVLDAMRLRVSPLRTACVVACCIADPAEYQSDEKVYDVQVLTVEQFEQRHALALSDVIIRQLTACETLPDFQRLVRDYSLEKAMDYEPDERFDGGELDRLYDAIDAAAVRVGLRRREEEGAADEGGHVVGSFIVEEPRAELERAAGSDAVSDDEAADTNGATQNISGGEPSPAMPPVPQSLLPVAESSSGASEAVAALRPQMHPRRIQRHPLLLMRAGGLNEEHVKELEAVLVGGGRFKDPNVVFYDKVIDTYWNAEGNHRHEAALRQDALLDVDVRNGTLEDAIEFAAGSNAEHGLKRNDNDRRLAVVTLLSNTTHFGLSDGLLSKKARVTPPFIGDVRDYLRRALPFINTTQKEEIVATDVAEHAGVPVGLVQVVLSLPEERLTSLKDNVAFDTGERLGADGRTYKVKSAVEASSAKEVAALPFEEESGEEPEPEDSGGKLAFVEPAVTPLSDEGATARSATVEAPADANPAAEPARYVKLKLPGDTRPSSRVGKIVGRDLNLYLIELPTGETNKVHETYLTGESTEAEFNAAAGKSVGAATETPEPEAVTDVVTPATPSAEEPAQEDVVVRDHRRFAGELDPTQQKPSRQPSHSSPPPSPSEADFRRDIESRPSPPYVELIGDQALAISFTWLPALKGKVNVSINVGGKPANEARRVLLAEGKVLPFTAALNDLVMEEVGKSLTAGAVAKNVAAKKEIGPSPKAERIVEAIKGAKSVAELKRVEEHNKLDNLSRFAQSDADLINRTLLAQRKKVGGSSKKAPASKKGAVKAPAKKGSAKKGAAKKGSAKTAAKKAGRTK